MRLSITDIENNRALILSLGRAFIIFFGSEVVFGEEKPLFSLSFGECTDSEVLKNGLRLYFDERKNGIRSHVDVTISRCNGGIALTVEAMHDCRADINTPSGVSFECINDGDELFSLRLSREGHALTISTRGSCSVEDGKIKLRRGVSKFILLHDGIEWVGNDDCRCFEYEARKCNEILFNGKELNENSPLLPWLLLSEGLRHGHFDIRLAERLSDTAEHLSEKESSRALEALGRYIRAFGERPVIKPNVAEIKHLTNTELLYARSVT